MMILADYREPINRVQLIKRYTKLPVKRNRLEIGDYLIGDVCIEHKTASDFINSITTKRIWEQLFNISQYPIAAIIVSGDIKEALLHHRNPQQVLSMVDAVFATLILKFPRVNLLTVDSDKRFAYIVARIAEQYGKKGVEPIKIKKAGKTIEEIREDMLCCIPTVGRSKAREILSQTTLRGLAVASIGELRKLKGVGKKTAKIIAEVFGGD